MLSNVLDDFFYTLYGLGTLVAVTVLVTSLVWCICCCCVVCCRRWYKKHREGSTVVEEDLQYVSAVPKGSPSAVDAAHCLATTTNTNNNTFSSGYHSTIDASLSYSLQSLENNDQQVSPSYHTSLDNILNN